MRPWMLLIAVATLVACSPESLERVDASVAGRGVVGTWTDSTFVAESTGRELAVRFSAWGRGDAANTLADGLLTDRACDLQGCDAGLERRYPGIVEWWVEHDVGLKHGWTVNKMPTGMGALVLQLDIPDSAVRIDSDGLGATLLSAHGGWRYEQLVAWDADGRDVPGRLESAPGGLLVVLDVDDARLPITVDPVLSSVYDLRINASDGTAEGNFGVEVSNAGDVNGDGFLDIMVGSPSAYGDTLGGAVYVYYGQPGGIDVGSEQRLTSPTPGYGHRFGGALSSAGDVDGDGFADLLIGSAFDAHIGTQSGAAFVFYGGLAGVDESRTDVIVPSNAHDDQSFGSAVGGGGDIDGDGFADLIVGSLGDFGFLDGAAFVYYGGATGLDPGREDIRVIDGGESVFGVGLADFNADGFADIAIGALTDDVGQSSGSVHVFLGAATGVSANGQRVTASDGAEGATFGFSVASAGDVDGDGFGDLVVGAIHEADVGAAYVYYGDASGVSVNREDKLLYAAAVADDFWGGSVSSADVNGDGFHDVIIGGSGADGVVEDAGAAVIFYGSPTGVETARQATLVAADGASNDFFGDAVAGTGDLDGDGTDDVLIGAPSASNVGGGKGAAYLFLGSCDDLDADGFCASEDCDDEQADVFPGAEERCNGIDDDCDGTVDGPDATGLQTWFPDSDGDGFTANRGEVDDCDPPDGYAIVSNETDCDDADPNIYPGASEVSDDGVDQDCDGSDAKGDGTDSGGCGCSSAPMPTQLWFAVVLLGLVGRRRS